MHTSSRAAGRAEESGDMQTGRGGRGAQGRPPARLSCCGAGFEACRSDLFDPNQAYQQTLVQIEIGNCERRLAAAHLGHGNVVVPGMLLFTRMLVIKRTGMVHMRVFSVAVEQLSVEMDTPRSADVAIGVHMHVQAAELYGQKAHTCEDRHGISPTAHGEKCITPAGGWSWQPVGGFRDGVCGQHSPDACDRLWKSSHCAQD